jgi:hypothetical protein
MKPKAPSFIPDIPSFSLSTANPSKKPSPPPDSNAEIQHLVNEITDLRVRVHDLEETNATMRRYLEVNSTIRPSMCCNLGHTKAPLML